MIEKPWDADELEERVSKLMVDDDVTKLPGIYPYVLTENERHLSIRLFTPTMRTRAYERQNGCCAITGEPMVIGDMDADHIIPWSKGGKTLADNCQMVSKEENRRKGAR